MWPSRWWTHCADSGSSTSTEKPIAGPSSLKRSLSVASTSNVDDGLPFLPPLSGDLILEVFTHKSLIPDGMSANEDFADNERLSELGGRVLSAIVSEILFSKKPLLKSQEMAAQLGSILSNSNIEVFVKKYRLQEKLRCHPDIRLSLNSAQEAQVLFHAYVGAVYIKEGIGAVKAWIGKLVDPTYNVPGSLDDSPRKKMKRDSGQNDMMSGLHPRTSIPFPAPQPAAPLPTPPNPLAPAQPNLPFLPLFNQTASQRRVTVEYPAEFSGPPHAPHWMVKCVVNGIEKGRGTGGGKQLAKEEAARQAYYAMGWAPRG